MGRAVGDVDVATSATPQQVLEAAKCSPHKAIPTGIAHGTVTVIVQGKPFEVTTLRADTVCDGRHAQVRFIDDWEADARRRDFTINALMLSPDGTLYDYVGGLEDASVGRVRFIGDARARIAEDYLRILRLFRFYATHGRIPSDADTLVAVRDTAPYLTRISVERIAQEMMKLLAATDPYPALALMQETGVLAVIESGIEKEGIGNRELRYEISLFPDSRFPIPHLPLLRLAVLYPTHAIALATHWKRSRQEIRFLKALTSLPPITSTHDIRLALYRHERAVVTAALLRDAAQTAQPPNTAWLEMVNIVPAPVFPVSGDDLLKYGIVQGKALGVALKELEARWIASDFEATKETLLPYLHG
jgi:tRNA nucleotidyltransferase/poly(A) polymerase